MKARSWGAMAGALLACACAPPQARTGATAVKPGPAALAELRAGDAVFRAAARPCATLPLVPSRSHDPALFGAELSRARDACVLASRAVLGRPFGSAIPEPFRSRLNLAVRQCAAAYGGKAAAFAYLNRVANGDGDPRTISGASQWMILARRDAPACVERYAAALDAVEPGLGGQAGLSEEASSIGGGDDRRQGAGRRKQRR